ncbi:MAG: PAS domain S-box protein [Gammaproteobacteria bacterium]|nr:PAS domain S-box protein [Gammaproteobacteria bacterium]
MIREDDRYRWLFRNCPALMGSIDADGRYVDASDAYLKRLGYTREEIIGRRPQEHMTAEAARRMSEEYLPRFLRTGVLTDVPMDRIAKNGEVVEFMMSAIAERDAEGNFSRSIAVFTEQTQAARIERHYRDVYRQTPAMLHTTGLDARIEAVSDYWLEKLGYPRDEVVGAPVMSFLTEASREQAEKCMPRAFETGMLHEERLDFIGKDGGTLEGLVSASADRNEEGAVRRMLVVVHDVTERNRAEAEKQRAFEEIARLNEELRRERDYLREEVKVALNFGRIVGSGTAIKRVLKQVELVAPTDANVMIFGESGTGKELIASAIHERSERGDGPMVRVNCGAIPRELFESEFFGHVKGSFTGAVKDRIGRFELADGGTLFLDEVGEIPLDLQSKLLRVLQEGEFERVGEDRTRKVNVRVLAATNRDLKAEMQARRFREDLYFRLNVIPIEIPPLRERVEDIPQLAAHFVELASRQLKRPAPKLTQANLLELQRYHWPGNIRELQNVIERAAILSQGNRLQFDLPDAKQAPPPESVSSGSAEVQILREADRRQRDREAIIAALQKASGRVAGRGGAAEILGVKPTTLTSRINALGIKKPART